MRHILILIIIMSAELANIVIHLSYKFSARAFHMVRIVPEGQALCLESTNLVTDEDI